MFAGRPENFETATVSALVAKHGLEPLLLQRLPYREIGQAGDAQALFRQVNQRVDGIAYCALARPSSSSLSPPATGGLDFAGGWESV